MDLFYIPKVGDRVRIKKSKLTGTVIKEGTNCIVKLDDKDSLGWAQGLIVHYRRLAPTNKALINRTAIRKAFSNLIKKLSF